MHLSLDFLDFSNELLKNPAVLTDASKKCHEISVSKRQNDDYTEQHDFSDIILEIQSIRIFLEESLANYVENVCFILEKNF